jgi:diadenosine tetraphosphate (Ap4A) HIT family hydrolase
LLEIVDHVHFHVIPKPDEEQGLQIGWPQQTITTDKLKEIHDEIKSKL